MAVCLNILSSPFLLLSIMKGNRPLRLRQLENATKKNCPSPLPGSFHMTLLQCCQSKVKQSLKAGNLSPTPPAELVIVTKMHREYVNPHEGMIRLSKTPSNVYFHCHPSCVQKQQPFFILTLVTIHREMKPLLGALHRQYIYENFGLMVPYWARLCNDFSSFFLSFFLFCVSKVQSKVNIKVFL